jgi:multidrug resistance efflux pump
VHALITLHLHTAADEDKRAVQLSYLAQLQAGLEVRRREERHDFVTQEAIFDVEEAAAAAVAKAEEQQDQQQQQQQHQHQQQLKKQRVK